MSVVASVHVRFARVELTRRDERRRVPLDMPAERPCSSTFHGPRDRGVGETVIDVGVGSLNRAPNWMGLPRRQFDIDKSPRSRRTASSASFFAATPSSVITRSIGAPPKSRASRSRSAENDSRSATGNHLTTDTGVRTVERHANRAHCCRSDRVGRHRRPPRQDSGMATQRRERLHGAGSSRPNAGLRRQLLRSGNLRRRVIRRLPGCRSQVATTSRCGLNPDHSSAGS